MTIQLFTNEIKKEEEKKKKRKMLKESRKARRIIFFLPLFLGIYESIPGDQVEAFSIMPEKRAINSLFIFKISLFFL